MYREVCCSWGICLSACVSYYALGQHKVCTVVSHPEDHWFKPNWDARLLMCGSSECSGFYIGVIYLQGVDLDYVPTILPVMGKCRDPNSLYLDI